MTRATSKSSGRKGSKKRPRRQNSQFPHILSANSSITREVDKLGLRIYAPYNEGLDIRKCLKFNSPEPNKINDQGVKGWKILSNFILREEDENFKESIEQIYIHKKISKGLFIFIIYLNIL